MVPDPMLPFELEPQAFSAAAADGDIFCVFCAGPVTGRAHRIGAEARSFQNPAGDEFTIGLFKEARCACPWRPTADFTWFPGYLWQVALCASCQHQIGWFFSGGEHSFYGLILNHLIFS